MTQPFQGRLGGIDLRSEFKILTWDEDVAGWYLHRKLYRDALGKGIKCRCSIRSESPSPDCNKCFGTGYIWVESPLLLYSTYYGNLKDDLAAKFASIPINSKLFYADYDPKVSRNDLLIRVELNPETGKIVIPIRRLQYFRVPNNPEIYSSARGVPEFWKIHTDEVTIQEVRAPKDYS